MIWRRLLVCDDSTIADLHYIIQIAMGWSDDHLHQFRIHGKRYGIYRIGGISFSDDPNTIRLKDLGLRIKVQVVIESNGGHTKAVVNITCLERGTLHPAQLGLTLDETRDLLESMQHTVVEQQVAEYLEQQAHCPGCGKKRRRKGHPNPIVYRTLFGKLRLPSERFFHCGANPIPPGPSVPWPNC